MGLFNHNKTVDEKVAYLCLDRSDNLSDFGIRVENRGIEFGYHSAWGETTQGTTLLARGAG